MALRSLLAALCSFALLGLGISIPLLGRLFLYAAPLAGLAGLVMGGLAIKAAKKEGESGRMARASLTLNGIAFVLSALFALACTGCSSCAGLGGSSGDADDAADAEEESEPSSAPPAEDASQPDIRAEKAPGPTPERLPPAPDRLALAALLDGLSQACAADPRGRGVARFFHPAVFARLQSQACALSEQSTQQALTTPCGHGETPCSEVAPLSSTSEASRSLPLGLSAESCRRYLVGDAKLFTCDVDRELRIVDLERFEMAGP